MIPDAVWPLVERLAGDACPAIRYRTRTELLDGCREDAEGTDSAQTEVLGSRQVTQVLHVLENTALERIPFHGYDSLEAYAKILVEHRAPVDHPATRRLLDFLGGLAEDHPYFSTGIGKVGRILDDRGVGGARSVRAAVLAHAGLANAEKIAAEVQRALGTFELAAGVQSAGEITETYGGKLVYARQALLPGYYQLRLLAYTESWRSPPNRAMVAAALHNLTAMSPLPHILIRCGSQLISPSDFAMLDWHTPFADAGDGGKMMWLARAELVSRLGLPCAAADYVAQAAALLADPDRLRGLASSIRNTGYFRRWGAYTGLALEDDWRSVRRKVNDLAFRLALVVHHATGQSAASGEPCGEPRSES